MGRYGCCLIWGTIPVFAGGTIENGLSCNSLSPKKRFEWCPFIYKAKNYPLGLNIRCLPFVEFEGSFPLHRSRRLGYIPSKMNPLHALKCRTSFVLVQHSRSQILSDRVPVNSCFCKKRAQYNWCQGHVPDRGPAVEKHLYSRPSQ
jgi:hypothetical protein